MISFEVPELYGLEVEENIAIQRRRNDINKKMKIAGNVLKVCESEVGQNPRALDYKVKAAMYVNEDINYIKAVCKTSTPNTTFCYLIEALVNDKMDFLPKNIYEFTRRIILQFYLNTQRVPKLYDIHKHYTTKEYTAALFNNKKNEINMTCMILKKCGFVFQQLPRTNKFMIVEDPEQAFSRHRYLHKIKQYRAEGRYIVYIEDRIMSESSNSGAQKYMMYAASSKVGLISSFLYHKSGANKKKSFLEDCLKSWLIDVILPQLYANSVLVFENKDHHDKNICAIPTEKSSKREMIAFLEENNIPHDSTMHRASLLNLVKKIQKLYCPAKYPLDEFVKNRGFEILRRPKGLPSLDIFDPIWGHLIEQGKSNKTLFKELSAAARSYTNSEWQDIENRLVEKEEAFYKDDIKLELVIDKIMTLAKHNGISNNELKQFDQNYSNENCIIDDIVVI